LRECVDEVVSAGVINEVGSEDLDSQAGKLSDQISGDFLEKVFAPSDENESLDAWRKLAGIFQTQPGAGSRDESTAEFRRGSGN
jgi:hypothetical protein